MNYKIIYYQLQGLACRFYEIKEEENNTQLCDILTSDKLVYDAFYALVKTEFESAIPSLELLRFHATYQQF